MNKFFTLLLLIGTVQFAQAQCDSDAGTMSSDLVIACDGETIEVTSNSDQFLEADDLLRYYLHDASGTTLGNVFAISDEAIFNYDFSLSYGVTYYISAVVGNDDGSGLNIDLDDPCLSVAAGTPVVWSAPVLLDCFGDFVLTCVTPEIIVDCGNDFIELSLNGVVIGNPFTISEPGTYLITATNQWGCFTDEIFTVSIDADFPVIDFGPFEPLSCENTEVLVDITGAISGATDVAVEWIGPNGFISTDLTFLATIPGTYCVTIINLTNGCTSNSCLEIIQDFTDCPLIQGTIFKDDDGACTLDAGETNLQNWVVEAVGTNTFYGISDENGLYTIPVAAGDYEVNLLPPNSIWSTCNSPQNTTVIDVNNPASLDFGAVALYDCEQLSVDISAPFLRRCFDVTFYVDYCNIGTVSSENPYVQITFDEHISINSAGLPFTDLGDNVYQFDLDALEIGECGEFQINVYVSCDAMLGETLCNEAHIFPDEPCEIAPTWSGASIELSSDCDGDNVEFTLENVGNENMDMPSQFIVIEDGIMLMSEPENFQLDAGQNITVTYPANGSTYHLQATQVDNHPGFSMPILAVEGCGENNVGSFSMGFVNQFPNDDLDPFLDIDCQPIIGAYDPNDKRAFPAGYGENHLLEKNTDITYHIRFQNTGTDTAFNVVIEDIISPNLDISTLRPGVSSHDYHLEIHGADTLRFYFDDILLPDSFVNEPASHGFVRFKISQQPDLVDGTIIDNEAGIYFDFNEPVITNTVTHMIGTHFIEVSSQEVFVPNVQVNVFPNPANDAIFVEIEGQMNAKNTLELHNLTGKLLQNYPLNGAPISVTDLPEGVYFYQILNENKLIATGKLVVQ